MGANGNASYVNDQLLQNIIVRNKVKADIKEAIASAARSIAKGLQIEHPLKWRIEKIDGGNDRLPYQMDPLFH
jgi:ABC-type sugar transport system ATPase subunit